MIKGISLERFTGTLLDRLSTRDVDEVSAATRSRGELRASSMADSILRDLEWLLNTTRLESSRDLSRWPRVRDSVVNYGVPALTGHMLSSTDLENIEQVLTRIVRNFEPRLRCDSVEVRAMITKEKTDRRSITLVVTGICDDIDGPEEFCFRAKIDPETGNVSQFPT